jgi:hypothetical protein
MCHCRLSAPYGKRVQHRRLFERGAVSVVQVASKTFTRNSAVGKLVTFHFCPECGSTLFWHPSACRTWSASPSAHSPTLFPSRNNPSGQTTSTPGLAFLANTHLRSYAAAAQPERLSVMTSWLALFS